MENDELIEKLQKAANHIHEQTIKGPANYIITSAENAEELDEIFKDLEMRAIIENRFKKLNELEK